MTTLPSNWQWMPGMRAYQVFRGDRMNGEPADDVVYYRVLNVWVATKEDVDSSWDTLDEGQTYLDVLVEGGEETYLSAKTLTPDFKDPSTQGCLFARVREVWGPDVRWVLSLDDKGHDYTLEAQNRETGDSVERFYGSNFSGVLFAALTAQTSEV